MFKLSMNTYPLMAQYCKMSATSQSSIVCQSVRLQVRAMLLKVPPCFAGPLDGHDQADYLASQAFVPATSRSLLSYPCVCHCTCSQASKQPHTAQKVVTALQQQVALTASISTSKAWLAEAVKPWNVGPIVQHLDLTSKCGKHSTHMLHTSFVLLYGTPAWQLQGHA
jgi:hypothetical protein